MASLLGFLRSQLLVTLPKPTGSFAGKTVIVTGSNIGLGKEAARHFAALGASTLILAVRSLEKGEAAKVDIEDSTSCAEGVVKVWQLDLSSYASVQKFAERCNKELNRVDILLANAGIVKRKYSRFEDNESTITVNVVSTFLLAFLLLPKLKETAQKYGTKPNLTITSSDVHHWSDFKEKSAPEGKIFDTLNDEKTANMADRYQVSKLLEVFTVREMAKRNSSPVVINCVNPGLCHSALSRESGMMLEIMKFALARTTEAGSRTLVHAASAGPETNGKYLSDCKIEEPSVLVRSDEGKVAQSRVWDELVKKLEAIKPGVTKTL